MSSKPHKNLDVWKLSMELCKEVYAVCEELPPSERYGLSGQMKRAATSVPINIAEGAARNSRKEFVHFLGIAMGSLSELDTQMDLCCNYLGLLQKNRLAPLIEKSDRVGAMITALKKSLVLSLPNGSLRSAAGLRRKRTE
jgi:four helix bundle protein